MKKLYEMSDTLGQLLGQLDNDMEGKKQIHEALDFYINQYEEVAKKVDAASIVHSFHFELDSEIGRLRLKRADLDKDVKCGQGCSYCCYSMVDISRDEAVLIKGMIKEEKIDIDMFRLKHQAKSKSLKEWGKLKPKQKRCVFLDESDLCMIYKHRPAACRKLLVITDPEFCNQKKVQKVGRFIDWHVEVIASAILNGSKSGTLPEMLLEVLNERS